MRCFVVGLVFSVSMVVATPALAATLNTGLDFGTSTGLSTQDIRVSVAKIIRAFIGILGILALGITLTGGFLWMTSGGDETKITTAKRLLANGAIGLTIILLSFSITQFVISRLNQALGDGGAVTSAGVGFGNEVFLSGALGNGPIASHYPTRGAVDIARNARIFVTFRDEVDPASLAADTNANGTIGTAGEVAGQFDNGADLALPEAIQVAAIGVNVDPTKLTPAAKAQDLAAFQREAAKLVPIGVTTVDRKTFVFSPITVADGRARMTAARFPERALLGDGRAPAAYVVRLTPAIANLAHRADGSANSVFAGAFREGYSWDFTVSTTIDLTPPKIVRVLPTPDSGRDAADGTVVGVRDQPRNVLVQVNFDEAMDPTVVSGSYASGDAVRNFAHLAVSRDGTATGRLDGTFTIANQYQTVEFTTASPCARNTCGGDVYCLPPNADLTAWIDAARLEAGGPAGIPFSGVMDAAGNSLDGNGSGRAEGPVSRYDQTLVHPVGGDSVQWRFATNDTLDLVAPRIDEVVHYFKSSDAPQRFGGTTTLESVNSVDPQKPVEVLFTKLMSSDVATGVHLTEKLGCTVATGSGCLWSLGFAEHEDTEDADHEVDATRVTITHAPFREARVNPPPEYRVRIDSTVRDLYQNCFFAREEPVGPRGPLGGGRCVSVAGVETCCVSVAGVETCAPVP
jgi:hypothetical protein